MLTLDSFFEQLQEEANQDASCMECLKFFQKRKDNLQISYQPLFTEAFQGGQKSQGQLVSIIFKLNSTLYTPQCIAGGITYSKQNHLLELKKVISLAFFTIGQVTQRKR